MSTPSRPGRRHLPRTSRRTPSRCGAARRAAHDRRLALDDDVESIGEVIGSRGDGHVSVRPQVPRLALLLPGGEVERAVEPDGDQRRDVRPSFGRHRREPQHLRLPELTDGLLPGQCLCAGAAEPAVEIGDGSCDGHGSSSLLVDRCPALTGSSDPSSPLTPSGRRSGRPERWLPVRLRGGYVATTTREPIGG